MVANELVTLAEAGANVMVTAMATDVWAAVRSRFAALLSRGGASEPIAEELTRSEQQLKMHTTTPAEQIAAWQLQLRQVLSQHQDAVTELQKLVGDTERHLMTSGVSVRQSGSVTNTRSPGSVIVTGSAGDIHHGRG